MTGVSVVLCCYNSAPRLEETLGCLAAQKVPEGLPVEVILVNNASTDNTVDVARKVWGRHNTGFHFRIVEEPAPGHLNARIKGVAEARYDLILFCDDDNCLHDQYINRAVAIMNDHPRVGALGGKGIGVSDPGMPEWFAKHQSIYACGEQASQDGICTDRNYLWGAGLVCRRDILAKVFNPDYPLIATGRTQSHLFSGDDVEICGRIILLGYDLYYTASLLFRHWMPVNRLTSLYLQELRKGVSRATPVKRLYSYAILRSKNRGIVLFLIFVQHLFRYIGLKIKIIKPQSVAIVNPLKVYIEGIRKTGPYHSEYLKINKFAHYARTHL